MKLKTFYETLRDRIFAVRIFKPLLKIPGMKKLLEYETVSYLFFGFCTFIVSTLSYWGVNKLASLFITAPETYDTWVLFSAGKLHFKWIYIANAVSWICAVTFAFFTNKLFVFESRSFKAKVFWRELGTFVSARILSFILFEELAFAALELLFRSFGWNAPDWIAKILIAVFVVAFNYVASKLVIFRKQKQPEDHPAEPSAELPEAGSETE
jgi:putative flippase GtrA